MKQIQWVAKKIDTEGSIWGCITPFDFFMKSKCLLNKPIKGTIRAAKFFRMYEEVYRHRISVHPDMITDIPLPYGIKHMELDSMGLIKPMGNKIITAILDGHFAVISEWRRDWRD